ncbi:ectoine synthase [Streptomyces sp. WAC05374]|uniref:ectoine synthase n=1 Tax=unclassified Streptomyces TaxID=2593676 RepID=UPI000F89A615|nr:ectoine synthase [Streptomyces sp. WAC05374]RST15762.1 ectoine synthase [Streptomyces sp. WAC05374]TDF39072.1 ectoine synthase [Streptomyces sp. WAC05374]TDF47505.1 ectoine synthase [Streptomyces sp. WAC05374]TDF48180.1 ectoine synthase [Streptomyces sp. WAC05374]
MIIRDIEDVKTVEWGNGLSRRFLLASDGVGYSLTDTVVRAGTKSRLQYRNHLEACYCIEGSGEVIELDGTSHPITPGVLYALDQHDPHYLVASPDEDLRLVCVFSPALQGDEVHSLDEHVSSAY